MFVTLSFSGISCLTNTAVDISSLRIADISITTSARLLDGFLVGSRSVRI